MTLSQTLKPRRQLVLNVGEHATAAAGGSEAPQWRGFLALRKHNSSILCVLLVSNPKQKFIVTQKNLRTVLRPGAIRFLSSEDLRR